MYCAVVLDLYSPRVIFWSIDASPTAALVTNALGMAIESRWPPSGAVVHSDRGTQFESWAFTGRAKASGLVPSIGSIADCFDTAVILGGAQARRGDPAQCHTRPSEHPQPATRPPRRVVRRPERGVNHRTTDDVQTARRRTGRGAPPGKVIAEPSFGFWRHLLANRYSTMLWPAIRHAFPQLPRRGNHAAAAGETRERSPPAP